MVLPRFGYQNLAIKDESEPLDLDLIPEGDPNLKKFDTVLLDNLQNPFTAISSFKDLFFEYKTILEETFPEFEQAIKSLHEHFGGLLTHKSEAYLERFREVLLQKWQVFLEEGEHLYYIQYYYDWLCDLIKAYNELRHALDCFSAECFCENESKYSTLKASRDGMPPMPSHLLLGPVLGGRTSYQPLIFRDYFKQSFTVNNNKDRLNEIKLLHWRLMMMIWTFDLPFLRLETKVLYNSGYLVPAEEDKDSTDYLENQDINLDEQYNLEDLPIKITPSKSPYDLLGTQAIPYYYPLDANSSYSVHRFLGLSHDQNESN